jgi:ABC-type branched-subunit amino acid transport system ATPase component/ABC-type branched-subunit amino acid transport system permease subunit
VRHPIFVLAAVLIALSLIVLATGAQLSRVTQIAIYALYGMGVNLLVAYTGLVPFGASVFFGTATYVVAISLLRAGGNEFSALALAIVFSAMLALLLGVIILKRRGLYFSLLTLACSQIAYEVAFKWTPVTGGENGLQNVPRPMFTSPEAFHWFAIATVVCGAWFLWQLVHSPFGRALQAMRDNEQRMASLGFNTLWLKLLAFTVSGAVIGFAGGLLALLLRGAYANNLNWEHAGDSLLMTVLGGVHHVLGPLWGAIAFIMLEDKLSAVTEHWWLIFAPIVMLFALLSPDGIEGLYQRLRGRTRWTLIRDGIPTRPAVITPWADTVAENDESKPILSVRALTKRFGSLVTANSIDLDVYPNRVHSFIGPNGAGKTTFFNMLTGILPPTEGKVVFEGRDITNMPVHKRVRLGMGRSFQIVSVFQHLTVFENVRIAVQAKDGGGMGFWKDAYRQHDVNERTWSLLAAVKLDKRAADLCSNLSHGEQRLLEIAVTLATRARLLLLDEPLAGLPEADREIVAGLIRTLGHHHAVILIEHDMDRVLTISDRVTVLHRGELVADGKPAQVAVNPHVIEAYLGCAEGESGPLVAVPPKKASTSPSPLLVLENVQAGYHGSRILNDLSVTLNKGEVLALLGRNGVGKTTALRAIMGVVPVTSGRIVFDGRDIAHTKPYLVNRLGLSIVPEGRRLFPNLTVYENLRLATREGGIGMDEVYDLFPRLQNRRNIRAESLSGGERQMVAIARALMVPSRVILLDEPFEGLAPAVVKEVMEAVVRLRDRASLVIVEHHAESVLSIADRVYVLVNGKVAYEGSATALAADEATQSRLLGVVHEEGHTEQADPARKLPAVQR